MAGDIQMSSKGGMTGTPHAVMYILSQIRCEKYHTLGNVSTQTFPPHTGIETMSYLRRMTAGCMYPGG